jgi:hypothetical protein
VCFTSLLRLDLICRLSSLLTPVGANQLEDSADHLAPSNLGIRMPVYSTLTHRYVVIPWCLSSQAKKSKLRALYLMSTRVQSILDHPIIC